MPAEIPTPRQWVIYPEEEILILSPQAALTEVYENHADWKKGADRSRHDGPLMKALPIPESFVTVPWTGDTPNHAAAVLLEDGRTLYHTQPFTRPEEGQPATSHYVFPTTDLYGAGNGGSHGGSGLSALGGTIRLGELVPGGKIPHALKICIDSKYTAYVKDGSPGYRWPATKADGYASGWTYRGKVPALEMGALLALKPEFDVAGLETEPARILARALQDYGAYHCDSTGWDAFYLAVEWSPEGRVLEEFEESWGFPFSMKSPDHPWTRDLLKIIAALHVVDNNSPERIGGGGELRQPLARPLKPPAEE